MRTDSARLCLGDGELVKGNSNSPGPVSSKIAGTSHGDFLEVSGKIIHFDGGFSSHVAGG